MEDNAFWEGVLSGNLQTPNFVLYGESLCQSSWVAYLTFDGFEAVVKVEEEHDRVIAFDPVKLVNSGIIVRMFVTLAGPCAIIAFRITNVDVVDHAVSIELNSTLAMEGELHDAQLSELENEYGFAAIASRVRANFFCRHFPFTIDATGYSFGSSSPPQKDDGPSVKIWWEDQRVAASSEVVISTVVSWGEPSEPPVLQMAPLTISQDTIEVHGMIQSSTTGSGSIVIVVNDDSSRLRTIGWFSVGSDFSTVVWSSSDGLSTIPRSLAVYAIDDNGAISEPDRHVIVPRTATSSPSKAEYTAPFTSPTSYRRRRTYMVIVMYQLFFPTF
jgi:hypothetical protein